MTETFFQPFHRASPGKDLYRQKRVSVTFFVFLLIFALARPAQAKLDLDKLSPSDIQKVQKLIRTLEPLILERDRKKNLAKLTFEELYAPLSEKQRAFLKQFEKLDGKELGVKIPFRGMATGKEDLVLITGQKVKVRDKKKEGTDKDVRELSPQFLPPKVYEQYRKMMKAMEKDLGRRLLVESGYRSSAYQLYLFVFYLSNHDYSIRETVKFVALPGYSEHGAPKHQAVDLINTDGINGEYNTSEFDVLPEFQWLVKNAGRFGFELSYPKDGPKGITYEPWHWRFNEKLLSKEPKKAPGPVEDKKKGKKDPAPKT